MRKPVLYLAKMCLGWALLCSIPVTAFAQNVTISVNATQDKRPISPYIYGRNESFDRPDQFYKDARVRFVRIGGGNNMSAYNWKAKLAVHPDWVNNVYGADWDVLLANETTLPVNLISFSGKASSEGNILSWSTAEEVNNEGFEVESSQNGVTFEKIGFVAGKGTMSIRADYQFVDKQPLANAYYRLKQLDLDHSYTFSKTINVKNESGIRVIVYPNPVKGKLTFDVPPAKRHLIVRNTAGVIVDDQAEFSAGTYETSNLPKGLYLISQGLYTFKVLVQ